MRVLVLGPNIERVGPLLRGAVAGATEDRLMPADLERAGVDLLLSYGYRHVITQDVLDAVQGLAVNLHVSMLPWNRGADPNLWSWLENTPKGVSIHWMTAGLDRGPLVVQRALDLDDTQTLHSSYNVLQDAVTELLAEVWPLLESGDAPVVEQALGGTYHAAKDKDLHAGARPLGWDTPCSMVSDYGYRAGLWVN